MARARLPLPALQPDKSSLVWLDTIMISAIHLSKALHIHAAALIGLDWWEHESPGPGTALLAGTSTGCKYALQIFLSRLY